MADATIPQPTAEHLQLAGMALAHALWSIEYGDTLCTLAMVHDGVGEERDLLRFEADSVDDSVAEGLAELQDRLTGQAVAALVFDGYYTGDDNVRRDALIVELLAATPASATGNTAAQVARFVQQYTPGKRALLRRTRIALVGRPHPFGELPPDALDQLLAGAREHDKTRDLFEGI